jgi:hypothetical protein
MKRGSTIFLRGVVLFIALVVLALCLFVLPVGIRAEDADGYRPVLAGLYIPAVPFFFALYQALKLLGYIDKNQAFSDASIRTLKYIKYCALAISGLFVLGMPYIFHVADKDDAPGVVAIALVIAGASFVIATFAAVLQKLLQNAKDIKAENDLTV